MKTEIIAFNLGFRFKPGLPILALDINAIKYCKVLIGRETTFVYPRHRSFSPVKVIKSQPIT